MAKTFVMAMFGVLGLLVVARPVVGQACVGDCNGDGAVAVNELITGVNMALGLVAGTACPSFLTGENTEPAISDLIAGVNAALNGCPAITCTPPEDGRCVEITPGPGAQDALVEALIEARPYDVIFLRAGEYALDGQLSLNVDDVTIRGEGMNRTVLSFAGQTGGGEGLLVQADDFTIEDIGLEDAPGDLLKIVGGNDIVMRRVRAEWTGGPKTSNGAYGLYPVQCRGVLIEDSVVKGAADAGIYVGQSRNIVVRRNHVEDNVAGIEIENSTDADVYRNLATGNAGGILVFNLPGPPVQDGRRTRVYDNDVIANNEPNFGAPGSSVAGVPTGTGLMVLSNDQVEVFGNRFTDNNTAHIILVSYNTAAFFGQSASTNPDFDPYSETIFIHDNTYVRGGTQPSELLQQALVPLLGLPLPNILYDGDENPALIVDGALPAGDRICVQEDAVTFVDLDIAGEFAALTRDLANVDCAHDALAPVPLEGREIEIAAGPNASEDLLTALLEAQPGDEIVLGPGMFEITMSLSLTVDHVTLSGAGMDETILSFDQLDGGGEGLLVQADDFTIEDLALEDAPGDQLKILGGDGVTIRRVRAEWTGGPATGNGAYGLYPVQCKDVLIEDSVVKGASDAGVYVGQSRSIIVRRNRVEDNVAGIEIENSTGADVYDNVATRNTGGILIFNLPGLPIFGARTRVYNNQMIANNTPNFAPAGNIVASVPTGTGMFILANDQVEVFGNTISDNDTSAITILSFNTAQFFGVPAPTDPAFDPFSESLYILDNTYEGGGADPDLGDLRDLLISLVGPLPFPQIVFDGDADPDKLVDGALPAALRTCVQDDGCTFVNLNVPSIIAGTPMVSHDAEPFDCALSRLTSVAIAGVSN